MDRTDDRVGGRYRLLEVIGSGGMGRVWRAEDDLLLRTVAVKEITVPSTAPLATEAMREARAAARLDHPGVVKIFDVVWRQGRCWIVMEYVESRSLQRVIREDGPLPYREVARIGLAVLAALRTAHAAGVLHRDVKPDNVLLAAEGRVVLTDFGLATIGGPDGGPDPRLGSPSFIAPERLEAADAGVPSDLWSFGAMLYAAAEGRPPFARGDSASSLRALLTDPPDTPERSGPLTALILDLLAKDPAARPSPADVESRLRTALAHRPGRRRIHLRTVLGHRPGRRRTHLHTVLGHRPARRRTRLHTALGHRPGRRRTRLLLAALALLGLAATTILVSHRTRSEPGHGPGDMSTAAMISSAPVAPRNPCGDSGTATTGETTGNLPAGWIRFRDPTGFALALPPGWRRSPDDTDSGDDSGVCFADPSGRQALTVRASSMDAGNPAGYWRRREAATKLPGYHRISLDADWEYTWDPDPVTTRHERRVLLPAPGNRSYLLRWRVAEADWSATLPVQNRMLDHFAAAF
ncbi:serine/threonine-protein kinase [Actinoplanes regularis]|uniref:serine/threonine-protein kinase n=1 Tax=Actinoplanes regularis TaxID=52697 RepID=UPI0015C5907F|nr:serine/threonine-protein kinase [Actinoplanes regularis]